MLAFAYAARDANVISAAIATAITTNSFLLIVIIIYLTSGFSIV